MRVRELKEKLNHFSDNDFVCIESHDEILPLTHVYQGVNEADCTVFLTDYTEED